MAAVRHVGKPCRLISTERYVIQTVLLHAIQLMLNYLTNVCQKSAFIMQLNVKFGKYIQIEVEHFNQH